MNQSHPGRDLKGDQFSLTDLIPLEELQQLQDTLADINGVASVITDPDGHPLTIPSNNIGLCRIVRQSEKGLNDCDAILKELTNELKITQKPICRPCQNLGILNAAVPIIVNGKHLANWWISQYCSDKASKEDVIAYAHRTGVETDLLVHEFETLFQGTEAGFYKVLDWVGSLVCKITRLEYQNKILTRNVSKLHQLETELNRYKFQFETLVEQRTADLKKMNKHLQLQVLECNLAEEQIARKTKLLNAINQVLHQTIVQQSDQSLAQIFLKAAQALTISPFGFIVERKEEQWPVVAVARQAYEDTLVPCPDNTNFQINGIWQQIVNSGQPIRVQAMGVESEWQQLPSGFPAIRSLLALPLVSGSKINGFIALANNKNGYALVDQDDIETLAKFFMEALLRKRVEEARHMSEKRLNLAMDSANEGLWDYFPQINEIYFSERWFTMLGYMVDEFPHSMESWAALAHPDDFSVLEESLKISTSGSEDAFNIEIRMLARAERWQWVQVRGCTVERDAEGNVVRIVGTLIDISKYKQTELALQKANQELQRMAVLDELTQIANRRRFDDCLAQEWRRALRESKPLAMILCDIDHFKEYNDTYGHLKGDDALYTVAQAINSALKRPMDLAARYGGEEFALILPNTNIKGAMRVANEVKSAVDNLKIVHESSPVVSWISLSFGLAAIIPNRHSSPKLLVEAADQALYKAKIHGRNQIFKMSEFSAAKSKDGEEALWVERKSKILR